ncbi:MAG: hypothetical protein RMM17_01755 [Acidobacteriota bacterium]|nr:hypothetical protein [Blastocatellia bacterium]MDW8411395.1 hypothetical protein [Acidobacteriota bacterium]
MRQVAAEKIQRVYKRILSKFQLVWAVKRHYEAIALGIGEEGLDVPVDLGRVYGTLKVLYHVLPKADSVAILGRLEAVARDIDSIYAWFAKLDEKMSPYELRYYLEHAGEVDQPQLRALAKYFLSKKNPTKQDIAKVDYLLTHLFSWLGPDGKTYVNQESEEELESEVRRLLPRRLRRPKTERSLESEAKACEFIERLQRISSYDELIGSGIIEQAREFKNSLGLLFFDAGVLAKCIQLNIRMRNHFELFLREENQKLRQLAIELIGAGREVIRAGEGTSFSARDVLNFAELAGQFLSADYSQTRPYLEQISHLRNLMARHKNISSLAPQSAYQVDKAYVGSLAAAIDSETDELAVALQKRIKSLQERIAALQTARPSAVKVLHLDSSTLVLSSWELEAFKLSGGKGYLSHTSQDLLKKAVALIAELQENAALYKKHVNSPQLANTYLMGVNFYLLQAHKLADELEHFAAVARERNEIDIACNLSATRQKLLDSCERLKGLFNS